MSSKEKAKDLVDRFRNVEFLKDYDQGMNIELAKECAIICVNEALKVAFFATEEIYNHYLQVKQELESHE